MTPLLVSLVLLLPWTVATWAHQGPQSWLFEAGLPAASLTTPLTWFDVLFARPGGSAPWWLSAGLVAAAIAALARARHPPPGAALLVGHRRLVPW